MINLHLRFGSSAYLGGISLLLLLLFFASTEKKKNNQKTGSIDVAWRGWERRGDGCCSQWQDNGNKKLSTGDDKYHKDLCGRLKKNANCYDGCATNVLLYLCKHILSAKVFTPLQLYNIFLSKRIYNAQLYLDLM